MEVYEDLRAQALIGGRCRNGLAVFLFHGMAQGLAMLVAMVTTPEVRPVITSPVPEAMATDPALVKLLANMVLRVQSEVQHAY